MAIADKNVGFLRNLYQKGPFEGHALIANPTPPPKLHGPQLDYTLSDAPVTEWVPDLLEDYHQQVSSLETLQDHKVPMAPLTCGTHLYAAAFGCRVQRYENNNPLALPCVFSADEADQLELPDIENSPTLYRPLELARVLLDELGAETYLSPPDMQSGFDTAALIWEKSSFYEALILHPDAVKRLVDKCARLLTAYLHVLRSEFPTLVPCHCPRAWSPPELGPWLSNDECGVINTAQFEEFCLPELMALSETFGGLGMHCCADGDHQFDAFKTIPNFYAFNRVPGRLGWALLFEHFGGPEAPVLALPAPEPELARAHLRAAAPGTRFLFEYMHAPGDDPRSWLDAMRILLQEMQA